MPKKVSLAVELDFSVSLQPLAPCGTALEGALLGSFKVFWVGGRTVVSAVVALGVLNLTESLGWGLLGDSPIMFPL